MQWLSGSIDCPVSGLATEFYVPSVLSKFLFVVFCTVVMADGDCSLCHRSAVNRQL